MSKTYSAIDPGAKGGIAFYWDGVFEAFALPYLGNEIDSTALSEIVSRYKPDRVYCEIPVMLAGKSSGAKTSFKNFGRLKQFFIDRGVEWYEVSVQSWTTGVPKDKKDRVKICNERHSNLALKASEDGKADSLLLLEWAMRKYK